MKASQSDSELSESSLDGDESNTGSTSSNSSSSSASSYTSNQFDDEEENNAPSIENDIELVQIQNAVLSLPRDLCANKEIFNEFFSMKTWNMLPKEIKQSLVTLLPKFDNIIKSTETLEKEEENTIVMLFNNKLDYFGSTPLQRIQKKLEAGNYRPDVVKLRKSIDKSIRREHRFQTCERLSYLARELFVKRERLLRDVYKLAAPTGTEPLVMPRQHSFHNICADKKMYVVRARQRYEQEMDKLLNYVGLKPSDLKGNDNEHSENGSDQDMYSNHDFFKPVINLVSSNITEKCIFGTQFKRRNNLSDEDAQYQQQCAKQPRLSNKYFRRYLQSYKRRKLTEPNLTEFEVTDIRLRDVCSRAQMGGNFKRLFATGKAPGRKTKKCKLMEKTATEISIKSCEPINGNNREGRHLFDEDKDNSVTNDVDLSYDMLDGDIELQQEEVISTNYKAIITTTATSLEAPISITDNQYIINSIPLKQENNMIIPKLQPLQNIKAHNSPSSFFSLIRDLFCETSHHRLQLSELKDKLDHWLHQPANQFNLKNWCSSTDNWTVQVSSAIDFLCGEFLPLPEEYVPYLEFKTQTNIYQWIGAGRDSDARLAKLSQYWLQRLRPITTITKFLQPSSNTTVPNKISPQQTQINTGNNMTSSAISANTIHITITTMAAPTTSITTATTSTINSTKESVTIISCENQTSTDNIPPAPPARYPTNWTVRSAADEEIQEFQRQERERFDHPHRAFTYRLHGYESVVGPVKGIYSEIYAMTKARGHSMMVGDRPNFVTILTLVRDAVARMPNGEGTRADIAELVKSSQYLNHNAAENVLQTIVSGALDRMHTENDPCVRYDPKRKIWIYLHRHRSEEEFERIHHEHQTMIKKPNRKHNKKLQLAAVSTNNPPTITNNSNNNRNIFSHPPPLASVSDTCPLPALVPANTSMCYTTQQQQNVKQKQILIKCPPVPPLKYHVPPSTVQQQKSLLKSRTDDTQLQRILVRSIATTVSSDIKDDRKSISKQQTKLTQQVTLPRSLANKLTTKTPLLVATPNGLQTVHVPNIPNVGTTNISGNIVTSSALNAAGGINNKQLALNKPIIINQITTTNSAQQLHHKNHKSNPILKQHAVQQQQQQQTQSFIIPFNDALVHNVDTKTLQTGGVKAMFIDNNGQIQQIQQRPQQSTLQGKSVLRLISATTAQMQQHLQPLQKKLTGTSVQILRQQKPPTSSTTSSTITTTSASSMSGGISIITANKNVSGGTIVKMTPQAFAVLQQQQQQQQQQSKKQQHLILKPTKMLASGTATSSVSQQQSTTNLIVGSTGIMSSQQPQHNLLQTITPISVNNSNALSSATSTTVSTSISTVANTTNTNNNMIKRGVQTITATNLSLQQQRTLLQNLKQKQRQQNNTLAKTTLITNFIAPTHSNKQQNVTRTISATSMTTTTPTATNVITSTAGQIISLEDLLQKQRCKHNTTTVPQIVTLTSCGTQQPTAPQYGIVVSPSTHGILSINPTSSAMSATQSAGTTTTANNTNKRVSSPATVPTVTTQNMSINKSIASTTTTPTTKAILSGGRVLMAAPNANTIGGNLRIINTSSANTGATLSSLNFANLQGKQVVFTTKQSQSQLQNSSVVLGGQAVKFQGNTTSGNQLQTVIVGNQILRVQQIASPGQNMKSIASGGNVNRLAFPLTKTTQMANTTQLNLSLPIENSNTDSIATANKAFVFGANGKTMQLQAGQKMTSVKGIISNSNQTQHNLTHTVTNPSMIQGNNRVVLAVQSGAPFILPAGSFQGGTINLKSLQNMKLVSLAPTGPAAVIKEPPASQPQASL